MENKNDIFKWIIVFLTILLSAFIIGILAVIIFSGLPYLIETLKLEEIQFAMKLSITTATVSTFVCLLLALPIGYCLARINLPFRNVIQTLIELPLSLPYLVLGFSLLIIFSSPFGHFLKSMGINIVFDPKGIVLAQLIVNLPYAIRLIRTEIKRLDNRLEFSAMLLGASHFQMFRSVVIPQSRVVLIMAFALCWSRAMGEFGATLMLVGITSMKTETLPGAIYLNVSTGNNGVAMATAMIMLALAGVCLMITSYCNKLLKVKSRVDD